VCLFWTEQLAKDREVTWLASGTVDRKMNVVAWELGSPAPSVQSTLDPLASPEEGAHGGGDRTR
jgi:hypothetical protein